MVTLSILLIHSVGDEANFEGDKASALFEGPVPLTFLPQDNPSWTQNFYHLGDCNSPQIVKDSLMRGCFAPLGTSLAPLGRSASYQTCLDVAVLEDLGYPLSVDWRYPNCQLDEGVFV